MTLLDQPAAFDSIAASDADMDRRILLTGGWVVTMGAAGVLEADVLIHGDLIESVQPRTTAGEGVIRVDVSGSIVMPGLVDSHLHAWEGQLRGLAPDVDFGGYLGITHHGMARHYRPEDIAIGQRLAAARALDAGTTTIVDNSHNVRSPEHADAGLEALNSTGIRAVHAVGAPQAGTHDSRLPGDVLRLRDRHSSGGLVSIRLFDVAPTVDTWTFARDHGFDVCAEIGPWVPDLEVLAASGLMREGHTYNHCTALPPEVWRRIAESGAAVNLVPRSDSQYGLGAFVPALEVDRFGIRPGISSDNELTYGHDLFAEMRTLLTVQRGLSFAAEAAGEPDVPDRWGVLDVLRAATVGGASNAGLAGRIGVLEPGRKADVVVLSFDDWANGMWGSVVGTVVHSAGIGNVDSVFVDGRLVKWRGELVGVDERALVAEGERSREYLLSRHGASMADVREGLRR